MKIINLETPLSQTSIEKLSAGDKVFLSGVIYTGRDAAHARMVDAIRNDGELPFLLKNQVIYYVGPAPAKPGEVIGSAGPTTSYRMDDLTIPLLDKGLKGMIGKGVRSLKVIKSMKGRAIYFAAIGGAGALISNSIIASEVIAYDDLGAEAVRKLKIKNLPLIVAVDSKGNNVYDIEKEKYKREECNGL